MFKLKTVTTHKLTREDFLHQLRSRVGLTFPIGSIVTYTPPAPEKTEGESETINLSSPGHLGISIEIERRSPFARNWTSIWPTDDHVCPELTKPGNLFVVIGYEGDGEVQITTMDEDGDLHTNSVPASTLTLSED